MAYSTPEQLRFPPLAGHTVRADFEGGAFRPTLAPYYCAVSTARSALQNAWPPRYATSAIRRILTIPCVTFSPSGSTKSRPGTLTAMMPTVSGTIPC